MTRRELLGAVATVAAVLRETHDVQQFDRVLFHAPTDLTLCVYMLACQRLGAVYSATAVDAAGEEAEEERKGWERRRRSKRGWRR